MVAEKVKAQYTYEEEEESVGGLTIIKYVSKWTELDEEPDPDRKGNRVIVLKWGEEIINGSNEFIETLKKTAKVILPFLILISSLYLYKRYKKRKKQRMNEESFVSEMNSYKKDEVPDNLGDVSMPTPTRDIHQIRKLLIEWEKGLTNIKKKKPQETIQEWFKRINGPSDIIPIYEKVRYGEKECTHQEIVYLRKLLKWK